MPVILLAFLLLNIRASDFQSTAPTSLVPEVGPEYSFQSGILELRAGRGWLRTRQPQLNFHVTFEFRTTTPDADPGVFVRTWVVPQSGGPWGLTGYRVQLPTSATTDPASVLVGEGRKVTVIEKGHLALHHTDEWQAVDVTGDGPRITVALNGTRVGVFGVQDFGGYILLNNRHGRVQFRNLTIASTERQAEPLPDLMRFDQLKKAGGTLPRLIHEESPHYTMETMRAKVQGLVVMNVVVLRDGDTGAVRVTRSLHPDLDISAIAAVRAWQFEPAMLNNEAVPVLVEVQMSFTLR
jgi:TonB family protein